jgi:hypothetical protein
MGLLDEARGVIARVREIMPEVMVGGHEADHNGSVHSFHRLLI